MTVTLEQSDVDVVLLALACLTLDRPAAQADGRELAAKFGGAEAARAFDDMRAFNEDRYLRRPPVPLGMTGEFPDGKLGPDDQGEMRMAVSARAGNVLIMFGKELSWVGMPPPLARQLADALQDNARKAETQLS